MSVEWYQLSNFKCPITGCKGAQQPTSWVCANDGTDIYIAQTGNLRCSQVNQGQYSHFAPICNWGFDCGNHGDHPVHRFKKADLQGFSFALSHALQLVSEAGATWCAALITELGKQYNKE
ncbi:uncharacterized protein [Mytilus edulis]|uniref:uncharacterized protein n=1 Tax=Mytilus edulis TaxID=6550 RepID=UPI0039EFE515